MVLRVVVGAEEVGAALEGTLPGRVVLDWVVAALDGVMSRLALRLGAIFAVKCGNGFKSCMDWVTGKMSCSPVGCNLIDLDFELRPGQASWKLPKATQLDGPLSNARAIHESWRVEFVGGALEKSGYWFDISVRWAGLVIGQEIGCVSSDDDEVIVQLVFLLLLVCLSSEKCL